ncbi:MAG: polysaccharide deacetylase family protein [Sphingorhabdus sp.]
MRGKLGAAVDLNPCTPQTVRFVDFGFDGPRFIVTVDTEEEFDWAAPFTRGEHGTSHVAAIDRFQSLCDSHDVRPAYLVDYPIVSDTSAVDLLGRYVSESRADVGVQLHPWVNPPFKEEPSVHNSYACNLPPKLERAKLTALHSLIVERFGVRPQMYRAGRYGAGHYSRQILRDLGVSIDTSVRSLFDYTGQGGPNYADCPLDPYWINEGELLELPVTTVFSGALQSAGKLIFNRAFESLTSRGLLARTGMLERIALTPEGIPVEKAIRAVDIALARKIPILNFSFHSPSLAVGHTPYVRTADELERFYDWWIQIFAHLKLRGVKPTNVDEIARAAGIVLPE